MQSVFFFIFQKNIICHKVLCNSFTHCFVFYYIGLDSRKTSFGKQYHRIKTKDLHYTLNIVILGLKAKVFNSLSISGSFDLQGECKRKPCRLARSFTGIVTQMHHQNSSGVEWVRGKFSYTTEGLAWMRRHCSTHPYSLVKACVVTTTFCPAGQNQPQVIGKHMDAAVF